MAHEGKIFSQYLEILLKLKRLETWKYRYGTGLSLEMMTEAVGGSETNVSNRREESRAAPPSLRPSVCPLRLRELPGEVTKSRSEFKGHR